MESSRELLPERWNVRLESVTWRVLEPNYRMRVKSMPLSPNFDFDLGIGVRDHSFDDLRSCSL